MRDDLEQQLVAKYPQIFRNIGGDPVETAMADGISCGDGWFKIIDEGCAAIMALNPPADFCVDQVKEKFGGLRFYVSTCSKEIDAIVTQMEAAADKTCEFCGATDNVITSGGWLKTLCEDCRTV